MKKVAVMLVDGFETVEALAVVDILRRAKIQVDLVSVLDQEMILSAQKIEIKPDCDYSGYDFHETDAIFLPGGGGHKHYYENEDMLDMIKQYAQTGKLLCAICAAPSVLGTIGLLDGKKATCYPGFEDKLIGAEYVEKSVVKDGNIITSRGMGTSIDLGLAMVNELLGPENAQQIRESIIYQM